jgi:hypothetical protein
MGKIGALVISALLYIIVVLAHALWGSGSSAFLWFAWMAGYIPLGIYINFNKSNNEQ